MLQVDTALATSAFLIYVSITLCMLLLNFAMVCLDVVKNLFMSKAISGSLFVHSFGCIRVSCIAVNGILVMEGSLFATFRVILSYAPRSCSPVKANHRGYLPSPLHPRECGPWSSMETIEKTYQVHKTSMWWLWKHGEIHVKLSNFLRVLHEYNSYQMPMQHK